MTEPERILGVDISLRGSGVGMILARGQDLKTPLYGTIHNPGNYRHTQCLHHIKEQLETIFKEQKPQVIAIEGMFYCKSIRVAIALGEARGVVLAVSETFGVPVYEYAPRSVKKAIVGTGKATKEQMALMVKRMLDLETLPATDPADALALAICHHYHTRTQQHRELSTEIRRRV